MRMMSQLSDEVSSSMVRLSSGLLVSQNYVVVEALRACLGVFVYKTGSAGNTAEPGLNSVKMAWSLDPDSGRLSRPMWKTPQLWALVEILDAMRLGRRPHPLTIFSIQDRTNMAKTTTDKVAKSRLLGVAKSKKSSSSGAAAKSPPPKVSNTDSTAASGTKPEGKRKVTSALTPQVEDQPSKTSKKAAKAQAEKSVEETDTVEGVKGGKREKTSKPQVTKGDVTQSRSSKRKQNEVESDAEEDEEEVQVQVAKPKKPAARKEQSRVTRSSGANAKKAPSALSQPRKKAPSPSTSDNEKDALPDEDKENGPEEEEEEDQAHLFGFSTDDEDSSDDEVNEQPDPIEVSQLPTIAKDDASVKQKLDKAKRKPVSITTSPSILDLSLVYIDRRTRSYIPRQGTSWILRSPDEGILLPIRRGDQTSSFAQQKGLLHPYACLLSTSLTFELDWPLKTLRVHRVRLFLGRTNCGRYHGQLPAHGPHSNVQDHS